MVCSLHSLQFAWFAICIIFGLHGLHFAWFEVCMVCTLQGMISKYVTKEIISFPGLAFVFHLLLLPEKSALIFI